MAARAPMRSVVGRETTNAVEAGRQGSGTDTARVLVGVPLGLLGLITFWLAPLVVFGSDTCGDNDHAGICSAAHQMIVAYLPWIAVPALTIGGWFGPAHRRHGMTLGGLALFGLVAVWIVNAALAHG